MRIGINFHTFDRRLSGVEYYALGMIKALARFDGRNTYIVFTNDGEVVRKYVPACDNLIIRQIAGIRTRIQRIAWEHLRLPRRVEREKVDVLHCPSYICPVLASRTPYVVTVHDTIAFDHPQWCKRSNAVYYRLLMKAALMKAARVIAVSRQTADDLRRNFPLSVLKAKVSYPGIDSIFTTKNGATRHAVVRGRYGLPERFALFVGNREPKKNIPVILTAFSRLRESGIRCGLVMVGGKQWRMPGRSGRLLRDVRGQEVVWPGYVLREDLPALYQMAEVFVFPSLYEGFGFPPLEAMACGAPVIASQRGALAETVAEAAYTVEPDNAEALAEGMRRMITDGALRQKHIEAGRKCVRRFGWARAAAELREIYAEAAAHG